MKISPKLKDDGVSVHEVTFTYKDGKTYTAKRATKEQREKAKTKNNSIDDGCSCGEEFCDGQWLWRCMYAGRGECDWFITYIVCE